MPEEKPKRGRGRPRLEQNSRFNERHVPMSISLSESMAIRVRQYASFHHWKVSELINIALTEYFYEHPWVD